MANNILIISSDFTGHGHKSITSALKEQLAMYPKVSVHVVDGFSLAGNIGLKFGKFYGTVTRNAKDLWKLMWEISVKKPNMIRDFTEISVRDNFITLLKEIKPDLILSVHPNFNGSLINILSDCKVKVPFVTLVADLVTITPLWADPRVDYLLCPTVEAKEKSLEFGVPEEKIKVLGFPIRQKFCNKLDEKITPIHYDGSKPLRFLIMSGGEGSGNMSSIAAVLLKNFNADVTIITGRNRLLKRRLELTLKEKYPDRLTIHGFVDNVQDYMRASDIVFLRGSPNSMMEAVICNTPMIITGALPGQEEGNPSFAEKYNLGVVCNDIRNLKKVVQELLENNAEKLNKIKQSQLEFRDPYAARKIAEFLVTIQGSVDYSHIDQIRHKGILKLKAAR